MDNFAGCLDFTLSMEGGYSDDPADPGNWTGGIPGAGELRGTKCGISAAAYPSLNIQDLSRKQIDEIYRNDYYEPVHGDDLSSSLALVAFDAAVNAGVRHSVVWLQQSAGVVADGIFGKITLGALQGGDVGKLALEALARRLDYYARSSGWNRFGLGWSRRVLKLAKKI
ncbi:glycoside hydrolase family 108 protein [Acidocella sp.]|uniref:glycoside hydrolase family 108 protein n=1 Tax=Acidocella sp. TaxID=50710 RepID=UPI003D005522